MAVNKRRDFKRLSLCIQDFLKRLPCNEHTGFLRDTLYSSLLELHKYYIKEKERFNLSLQLLQETGNLANVSSELDKYDEKWKECDDGSKFIAAVKGNVHNLKNDILTDDSDRMGRTYLMYAIHHEQNTQQKDAIEHILSLNFNIDTPAHDGSTALHVACQHQTLSIAAVLLKNKANVMSKDKKGRSPLHWAAMHQSVDIVKLLLQYGADINQQDCDGMTPAMYACYFNKAGNFQVLRNALQRVDPRSEAICEQQDITGRTVLHWAAMAQDLNNNLICLKELLTLSDVCKVKDNQGRTALHAAALKGSISACQLIISRCRDVLNIKDNQSQTALHLATLCGHGEVVDFLLRNEADSSAKNMNKRTALQEAEIGHYHYCLLVFAAFEQMKEKESKPSLVRPRSDIEKKNNDQRRYESWVIPSTSLNESHDIPVTSCSQGQQFVDVTEVKGFEINNDLEEPALSQTRSSVSSIPGKSAQRPREMSPSTTRDNPDTTTLNPACTRTNKAVTTSEYLVATITEDVATTGNSHATRRGKNKNALLKRTERIDESKEKKEDDIVDEHEKTEGSLLLYKEGSTSLQEEELEGYSSRYLQQHGSASSSCESNDEEENVSISENIEVSSLLNESEGDKSDNDKNETENKTNEEMESLSNDENKINRGGSLAPVKPLSQLSLPAKLEPISLLYPNKKSSHVAKSQSVQPRGIVAPLQPPVRHHKELGQSLLSKDTLQHFSGQGYGTRGPEHGPLAQNQSKELLNSVFKGNLTKASEQKTPELQRKTMNNNPGNLSRPTFRSLK